MSCAGTAHTYSIRAGMSGDRSPDARLTTTLAGGGTWTYTYGARDLLPKDDPNSVAPALTRVTDDQNRVVDYYTDDYGALHLARANQSFDANGAPLSYLDTRYLMDAGATTGTHRYTAQVKNTWNWKGQIGNWLSKVLVQNDYTYADNGNRTTNLITDQNGPVRTETYGYDELARLTSVNYGDGDTQSYTPHSGGKHSTRWGTG